MTEQRAIFRSASVLGFFTVVSRATGFLRDVLLASLFGTGMAAAAFFVAFKIPNTLRDILGEGAGNAAFVPVFCEELTKRSRAEFAKLVNSVWVFLLVISGVISAAGIVFAPLLIGVIAPGFRQDPAQWQLTVHLTRLLFPYLILITTSTFLMSVANALRSFAVPACASVVFNLLLISGLLAIPRMGWPPADAVALFVLLAGVGQVLIQVPSLRRQGIDLRRGGFLRDFFRQEPVRRIGRLILPRLLGTSVYQLNIFVDTIFASFTSLVGTGAIAAIYFANRIIQFPFAVFGVSIANAALPAMATDSAQRDYGRLKATLIFSLRGVYLFLVPLTLAILVFTVPLVRIVFERGRFDAASTQITSQAVFFYALGLLAYAGVRFFSHAFYAMQDTLTPVKTAAVALFLNVVLNSFFVFVLHLRVAGLALASSISATVNFLLLYARLRKAVGFQLDREFCLFIFRTTLAACGMIVTLLIVFNRVFFGQASWALMAALAASGAGVYGLLLWVLDVKEARALGSWLLARR